jgi:acetyl esterase/lipase
MFRLFVRCLVLPLLATGVVPAAAQGGAVSLVVDRGGTPGEVHLEWTGGEPRFRVFRSHEARATVYSGNEIGDTADSTWTDLPPPGALFFYRVTGDVTVEATTLSYGADGAQALDLHTPQVLPAAPMPVALLAHGGLWQSGDKSDLETLCQKVVVASGGTMACASTNYRLSHNVGGVCVAGGIDAHRYQIVDLASAFALLQTEADIRGMDRTRMYVGGHSAGAHLSHELNLRWSDFEQPCMSLSACWPAAGAIGFEGIFDIAAWDAYDAEFWNGQFFCATRKAFGFPGDPPSGCQDAQYGLPCWHIGSPTYLADNADTLGIAPVGDALIIHSPGDNWVDIAEATSFGEAMSAAFSEINVITSTDGTCATGQHNDPLTQTALATCIVNFIALSGSGI